VILRRLASLIAAFACLWSIQPAHGETPAAPPPAPASGAPAAVAPHVPENPDLAVLAEGQQTIVRIQNQAASVGADAQLAALQKAAAAVQAKASAVLRDQSQRETAIKAELAKLRPHGGHARPPTTAEKARIEELHREKASVDAVALQATAVANAAAEVYGGIAQQRREGFSTRFLKRAPSPLFPTFWAELAGSIGADFERFGDFLARLEVAALDAEQPKGVIGLGAGAIVALALLVPVRRYLEHLGRRKSGESVHPGFARTAAAVWIVAVDTGMPTLAALALRLGAEWGGMLSAEAEVMADAAVLAVAWASGTMALGRVLATDADTSQHLLPVSADTGRRIHRAVVALALVTAGGLLLNRLNFVIGASVAATVATNCLIAIAYVQVAGLVLISVGGPREDGAREGAAHDGAARDGGDGPRGGASAVWTLISLGLAAAMVVTVGALLAGYTTLAALTSGQIFWLSMIAASAYLLLRFIDDLCAASFGPRGWVAHVLRSLFNLRRSTIEQTGVLLAAALELFLLIGALRLALTPFGQGGAGLFSRYGRLDQTLRIGSVALSPGAVAAGLVTLAVGMLLVRGARTWMVRRYLPVTEWDAGLRNSVTTGVVYLGAGIALISALAAMGLGFQQIALVASALSVGIGFGLQQIVQNFVAGVIVLIERPVKVGDWINVGGIDGDVRRIRVRATEIQTFDKATVIVPNSDLITKLVTNRTHGDHTARIALQLSIASPDDAERAAALIVEIAQAHGKVLREPAPLVLINSLAAAGAVNFDAYAHVDSARDVGRVRSELYFEILKAFRREGVSFLGAAGPTNVVVEPGPEMRSLIGSARQDASGRDRPQGKRAPPAKT
jgi:small-conductance mechanosensitive channel